MPQEEEEDDDEKGPPRGEKQRLGKKKNSQLQVRTQQLSPGLEDEDMVVRREKNCVSLSL